MIIKITFLFYTLSVTTKGVFSYCTNALKINQGTGILGNSISGDSGYTTALAAHVFTGTPELAALALNEIPSNGGGAFVVQSSSPLASTGVTVTADGLLLDGPVSVAGQLPLLVAVGLDGPVVSGGQAAIAFNGGNGNVGIISENGISSGKVVSNGVTNGPVTGSTLAGGQGIIASTTGVPLGNIIEKTAVPPYSFRAGTTGLGYSNGCRATIL